MGVFPLVLGPRTFLESCMASKSPGSKEKNLPCLESTPVIAPADSEKQVSRCPYQPAFLQALWLKVTTEKVSQEPCKSLPQQLISYSGLLLSWGLSAPLMGPLPTL